MTLPGLPEASQGLPRPCIGCRERRPPEDCSPADEACPEVWAIRHDFGDHRRCERFPHDCAVAAHHPAIRQAAAAALERTGRSFAVVCLLCRNEDGPRVLATFGPDLWGAKGLRNAHARRHRLGVQEQKGVVYVVGLDGDFL